MSTQKLLVTWNKSMQKAATAYIGASAGAGASPATAPPSAWSLSRAKRWFDCVFAGLLLLCAMPVMLLIAVLVKLDSRGPLLFRQTRVGQGGVEFPLLKFRSMEHRVQSGLRITVGGDRRVTRAGRFLRWSKLDEVPQLWNVLRGEMSVVGPRPDVAEFIATLAPELRAVTILRPGLTSPASIRFRHEEEILAKAAPRDPAEYYVSVVLPQKVALDLEYASHATLKSDLKVIADTALSLVR